MKYLYEILDGERARTGVTDVSHPQQILRRISETNRSHYIDVYIVNERGTYWNYILKRKNGTYRVLPVAKSELNEAQIAKVFVGNIQPSRIGG